MVDRPYCKAVLGRLVAGPAEQRGPKVGRGVAQDGEHVAVRIAVVATDAAAAGAAAGAGDVALGTVAVGVELD